MKIKIREVTVDGAIYADKAMPADLDLLVEFIDPESPVVVEGRLQRVDEFVLAKVAVTYTLDTICARCLENIHMEVKASYDMDFEFRSGEEFIDIGARVREEILMNFERHVLCREGCKGICPGCGVYLNEEQCECGEEKSKK